MAELKTKQTEASVDEFLSQITNAETRQDCFEIAKMMRQVTRSAPKMWGSAIVGFGSRRLKYASGRELDWMLTGFSPRKANITLYILGGFENQAALLSQLGQHSTGKGCLYIKRLRDVDRRVLKALISESVRTARNSSS